MMIEYKIEKNIPIPESSRPGKQASELSKTLLEMEVMDSIVIPQGLSKKAHASISYIRNRNPLLKFTLRNLPNETRVWRIE